jgi:hypothetical protein
MRLLGIGVLISKKSCSASFIEKKLSKYYSKIIDSVAPSDFISEENKHSIILKKLINILHLEDESYEIVKGAGLEM